MTQIGFEDYIHAVYNTTSGTANSYITAIRIIDQMFAYEDVFDLKGKSVTCIDDTSLLKKIVDFVCAQQTLYIQGKPSIFRNVSSKQVSYPGKRFCSAAIKQLLEYNIQESKVLEILSHKDAGKKTSEKLISFFKIDKTGLDKTVATRTRVGQNYFRQMILANYDGKCCVTGLNIPQTLRASHIVAWASDKANRMNPENGLCLSATYDAAFDKHLISFDDDYRMIIGKGIRDYYTNDVAKEYFEKYEGKQIILPKLYLPSKKLLEKHRELMFK